MPVTVKVKDFGPQYGIQKNEQNSLKGLLWNVSGGVLTSAALSLTAATIVTVAVATLASAHILTNSAAHNFLGSDVVPRLMGLAGATVLVDYLAVKLTGYCVSNSIHHYGPEYQIVKLT
jgi:hypothetical protein